MRPLVGAAGVLGRDAERDAGLAEAEMACFSRFSKIWSSHRRLGASGKLDWLSTPPGSAEDSPASGVFTLRTPRNLARSSADAFLEAYSFGGALRRGTRHREQKMLWSSGQTFRLGH